MISSFFASLPLLFVSSILFTYICFIWGRKLIADFSPKWKLYALISGVINGIVAVFLELSFSNPAPYMLITLVPLIITVELYF